MQQGGGKRPLCGERMAEEAQRDRKADLEIRHCPVNEGERKKVARGGPSPGPHRPVLPEFQGPFINGAVSGGVGRVRRHAGSHPMTTGSPSLDQQ